MSSYYEVHLKLIQNSMSVIVNKTEKKVSAGLPAYLRETTGN